MLISFMYSTLLYSMYCTTYIFIYSLAVMLYDDNTIGRQVLLLLLLLLLLLPALVEYTGYL